MLSRGKITHGCKTGDGKGNNFPKEEEPFLKWRGLEAKCFRQRMKIISKDGR